MSVEYGPGDFNLQGRISTKRHRAVFERSPCPISTRATIKSIHLLAFVPKESIRGDGGGTRGRDGLDFERPQTGGSAGIMWFESRYYSIIYSAGMIVLAVAVRLGCMPAVVCSTLARHWSTPPRPSISTPRHLPPSLSLATCACTSGWSLRASVCMRGSPCTRDTHVNRARIRALRCKLAWYPSPWVIYSLYIQLGTRCKLLDYGCAWRWW